MISLYFYCWWIEHVSFQPHLIGPTYISTYSGTHLGGWLSWQTPLHCRNSALKPIKNETLLLQVFNASVLEQATAYIFLLMLHSTIMKQQRYCFV